MNELKRVIEKANDSTLWLLLADISKHLEHENNSEIQPRENSKLWFWYELFKCVESEIDKRMIQEG